MTIRSAAADRQRPFGSAPCGAPDRRGAAASFERRMAGDEPPGFEDAHLVGEDMDVEDAAAGRVGNAVQIAADADHALVRDAALEPATPPGRARGATAAAAAAPRRKPPGRRARWWRACWVGDAVEPVAELAVEVIEIAERATEEEVFADVAERPLDLALRLGAIGPAGPGREAEWRARSTRDTIVDDKAARRPRRSRPSSCGRRGSRVARRRSPRGRRI